MQKVGELFIEKLCDCQAGVLSLGHSYFFSAIVAKITSCYTVKAVVFTVKNCQLWSPEFYCNTYGIITVSNITVMGYYSVDFLFKVAVLFCISKCL